MSAVVEIFKANWEHTVRIFKIYFGEEAILKIMEVVFPFATAACGIAYLWKTKIKTGEKFTEMDAKTTVKFHETEKAFTTADKQLSVEFKHDLVRLETNCNEAFQRQEIEHKEAFQRQEDKYQEAFQRQEDKYQEVFRRHQKETMEKIAKLEFKIETNQTAVLNVVEKQHQAFKTDLRDSVEVCNLKAKVFSMEQGAVSLQKIADVQLEHKTSKQDVVVLDHKLQAIDNFVRKSNKITWYVGEKKLLDHHGQGDSKLDLVEKINSHEEPSSKTKSHKAADANNVSKPSIKMDGSGGNRMYSTLSNVSAMCLQRGNINLKKPVANPFVFGLLKLLRKRW